MEISEESEVHKLSIKHSDVKATSPSTPTRPHFSTHNEMSFSYLPSIKNTPLRLGNSRIKNESVSYNKTTLTTHGR
jgi:hypothetical protein